MRYYCNICKKDITQGVYSYSKDKFGKPLCIAHQKEERRNQERLIQVRPEPNKIMSLDTRNYESIPKNELEASNKNIAVKMGKGVIRGVKKMIHSSKKRSQIRKWKEAILRRMSMIQLKTLCHEKKISTKKTVGDDDEDSDYLLKRIERTQEELVLRLRRKLTLDTMISFAQRNSINIREILTQRDRKRAEWKKKELNFKLSKDKGNFLLELEKAIWDFPLLRHYDKEMVYQDTLATFLQARYPNTVIEDARGSTRPDIVVNDVAIEIKGPTSYGELDTIANKSLRYPQYYRGVIIVLFDIKVSKSYFQDWLKGLNQKFPEVVVVDYSYY